MSEWIDVRDELPEVEDAYLVAWTTNYFKGEFVGICPYDPEMDTWGIRGMTAFFLYGNDIVVTHWMPLPEAPKKEVQA